MNRNKSDALFKEAQLLMPGGVNSPVRAFKNVNSKPVFFKSANGAYLIDEDEYPMTSFKYSIYYIFLIFFALLADHFI